MLLTIDENTTEGVDWAYDAKLNEDQTDDMFWMIDNDKYIIQGSDDAEVTAVYPLGVIVNEDGLNSITIDELILFYGLYMLSKAIFVCPFILVLFLLLFYSCCKKCSKLFQRPKLISFTNCY